MNQPDRYHRQTLLPQIGSASQARLASSRVLLIGCGALGTTLAELLVRAGVGFMRIVDRDLVELTNLQRQVLFDESDIDTPKAIAAGRRLAQVNSAVTVDAVVADVHAGNLESLAGLSGDEPAVHLLLDGTDNVETRYLLNDVAVKHQVPWVYGACVGVEGRMMPVRPGLTPCLRCVFPTPPGPGDLPTCDTAGVLGPAASMVAAMQATAAIQLLAAEPPPNHLVHFDLWRGRFRTMDLADARRGDCVCCGQRRFEFLDAFSGGSSSTSLCGRNAIQVRPSGRNRVDLSALGQRLKQAGAVEETPYLLRFKPNGGEQSLTVFPDGRAIVHGTIESSQARSIYAKWVGS